MQTRGGAVAAPAGIGRLVSELPTALFKETRDQ
jgi:hypothetical protein